MDNNKGLKIYDKILYNNKLNSSEKLVFSTLYSLSKKGKDDFIIDKAVLSKELDLSYGTIKNAVLSLQRNDFIFLNEGNKYMIHFNYGKLRGKSLFIPNNILQNKGLKSAQEKILLAYITSFTRNNKECKSSNDFITKNLNITYRMVIKYLKRFKDLDLIEVDGIKSGFTLKDRTIISNVENIEKLYQDCLIIENQTIDNVDNIENINNIENQNINNVENQNINNINNIENQNVENMTINLSLEDLVKIPEIKDKLIKLMMDNKNE